MGMLSGEPLPELSYSSPKASYRLARTYKKVRCMLSGATAPSPSSELRTIYSVGWTHN